MATYRITSYNVCYTKLLRIPTIESITIKVNEIIRPVDNVIIEGVVNSNPRISQFNNMRNELSKSLQFHLTDENKKNAVRVIIWNVDESKIV